MSTEIKAPTFPESIADGTLIAWNKQPNQPCQRDEVIAEIETDKVVLEVVAPADGFLQSISKKEGAIIVSNEVLAIYEEGAIAEQPEATAEKTTAKVTTPAATSKPAEVDTVTNTITTNSLSPAARKMAVEQGINPETIQGTGKSGRVTKEDVVNHSKNLASTTTEKTAIQKVDSSQQSNLQGLESIAMGRHSKRVPMSRLRATVAERLVQAQNSAAMLTTFNEVNMQPIMKLREKYKDAFAKQHDVKLGFMSFFIKACSEALKSHPEVNASIESNDIVYHDYQDIGVAVSSKRGLVVPVLRNTETKSLASIEKEVRQFSEKARDGKLSIDDMTGGTFTVSNGGVFGSLLSTPILNPPQSAILGMHKIQERVVVVDGKMEILPMMYLALSYDHRLLDGKEAVTFLVKIKDLLEDPTRIILQV